MMKLIALTILPWVGFMLIKKGMSSLGTGNLLNPAAALKTGKKFTADLKKASNTKAGKATLGGLRKAGASPAGLAAKKAAHASQPLIEKTHAKATQLRADIKASTPGGIGREDLERYQKIGGVGFRAELAGSNLSHAIHRGKSEKNRAPAPPRAGDVVSGVAANTTNPAHYSNIVDVNHPAWEQLSDDDRSNAMEMIGYYKGYRDHNGVDNFDHLSNLTSLQRQRLQGGDASVLASVPRQTVSHAEFETILSSFDSQLSSHSQTDPTRLRYQATIASIRSAPRKPALPSPGSRTGAQPNESASPQSGRLTPLGPTPAIPGTRRQTPTSP